MIELDPSTKTPLYEQLYAALADEIRTGQRAVAVFRGPHGYVSPGWLVTDQSRQGVPTWNFAVVHATGTLVAIDDPDARPTRTIDEVFTGRELTTITASPSRASGAARIGRGATVGGSSSGSLSSASG